MSMLDRPAFRAGGNINPCTFVKIDTAAVSGNSVVACSAGTDKPVGIAQEGTDFAPIDGASTKAAVSDEPLRVALAGEQATLILGGTVTVGDLIMSHTDGTGLLAAGSAKGVICQALQSGNSGDKIQVWIFGLLLTA